MRRFVIIEKHQPWLWDDDIILYHDRDFIIIRAKLLPNTSLHTSLQKNNTFYRAFMMFDKNTFGTLTMNDIMTIAAANKMDYYHNGLPYCRNKRIFAPVLRAYTDINVNVESIMTFLHLKRDSLIKAIHRFVKI